MGALNVAASRELLDHINLVGSWTPTGPLMLRLMSANGSASAAGTEVTGGSYAPQAIAFASADVNAVAASSADITFSDMPAGDVVGVEIWDSSGTPLRLWWGALTATKTVAAGGPINFPAGSITVAFPTA